MSRGRPHGSPVAGYRFLGVVADARAGRLSVDGVEVACPPQALTLLLLLSAAGGAVVSREQLQDALWPDQPFVGDEALTKAAQRLRAVLGPYGPAVLTVRKRGLRLTASISVLDEEALREPRELPVTVTTEARSVPVGGSADARPSVAAPTNPYAMPSVAGRRAVDRRDGLATSASAGLWDTRPVLVASRPRAQTSGDRILGGGSAEGWRRRRRLALSVATLVVAVVALAIALVVRSDEVHSASPPVVAVLRLENLAGRADLAWLGTASSELLTGELVAGGQLRAAPGEEVARLEADLGVVAHGGLGRDTLRQIARRLQADLVVVGSFMPSGPDGERLRLDLRLQRVADGELLASLADVGESADPGAVVGRCGRRLRDQILGRTTAPAAVASPLPHGGAAIQAYAEGLDRLRAYDAQGAVERFDEAIALEPEHALAFAALATAAGELGEEGRAREAARRANELAAGLPRGERRRIEALYRQTTGEWERATMLGVALAADAPDDLEAGLRLASVQIAGGHPSAALAGLEAWRNRAAEDPRVDLAVAAAAEALSDAPAQLSAARAAAAKSERLRARLPVAEARLAEGRALARLGEVEAAEAVLVDAAARFAALGHEVGRARAVNARANLLADRGDPAAAAAYRMARDLFAQVGARTDLARVVSNLALLDAERGELDRAESGLTEAVALARQAGSLLTEANCRANLGEVLRRRGAPTAAQTALEEALALYRQVGHRAGMVVVLNNLGEIARSRQGAGAARPRYEDAWRTARDAGDLPGQALAGLNLGVAAEDSGELALAGERLREALDLAQRLADRRLEAYALQGLGRLAVERDELAEADRRYSQAEAAWRALGAAATGLDELRLVRIDLELRRGALPAARKLLAESEASPDPGDRAARRRLLEARLELAAGHCAAAVTTLGDEERLRQAALSLSLERRLLTLGAKACGSAQAASLLAASHLRDEAAETGEITLALRADLLVARLSPAVEREAALRAVAAAAASRGYLRLARLAEASAVAGAGRVGEW